MTLCECFSQLWSVLDCVNKCLRPYTLARLVKDTQVFQYLLSLEFTLYECLFPTQAFNGKAQPTPPNHLTLPCSRLPSEPTPRPKKKKQQKKKISQKLNELGQKISGIILKSLCEKWETLSKCKGGRGYGRGCVAVTATESKKKMQTVATPDVEQPPKPPVVAETTNWCLAWLRSAPLVYAAAASYS